MNALVVGIGGFFVAALGVTCPREWIYVPALIVTMFTGGFSGGVIFSMQSEGVYELRILARRLPSSNTGTYLGGIWTYGLIGVTAGAVGLLFVARIVGINDQELATALTTVGGIAGAIRRVAICVGIFAVTVVAGFLGINLIRMVSDRLRDEIQKNVKQEVEDQFNPLKLLDKGKTLLQNHAYGKALQTFRELKNLDSTLLPVAWEARSLRLLGRLDEAISCLNDGIRGVSDSEDKYRIAVVYWNRGCYKALRDKDKLTEENVRSIVEDLQVSLDNEGGFKDRLESCWIGSRLEMLGWQRHIRSLATTGSRRGNGKDDLLSTCANGLIRER